MSCRRRTKSSALLALIAASIQRNGESHCAKTTIYVMTHSHLADLAAWVVASRHRGQLGSVSASHHTDTVIEPLLPSVYGVKPWLSDSAGGWGRGWDYTP